jgi:hypothetical protein
MANYWLAIDTLRSVHGMSDAVLTRKGRKAIEGAIYTLTGLAEATQSGSNVKKEEWKAAMRKGGTAVERGNFVVEREAF